MMSFREILQVFFLGSTIATVTIVAPGTVFADEEVVNYSSSLTGQKFGSITRANTIACKDVSHAGSQGCGCYYKHGIVTSMPSNDNLSEHTEGRIAFLKAEIGITDSQTLLWNDFAEVLRDLAHVGANARESYNKIECTHGKLGGDESVNQVTTQFSETLASHETMITAYLTVVKALRESYDGLEKKFTDQQKIITNTLIKPYLSYKL